MEVIELRDLEAGVPTPAHRCQFSYHSTILDLLG